jgi:hypothetical protein
MIATITAAYLLALASKEVCPSESVTYPEKHETVIYKCTTPEPMTPKYVYPQPKKNPFYKKPKTEQKQ